MKRPTLATIAEKAGTSQSTVSRVLSGQAEAYRISPAMRQRILEIAKALDYRPNMSARMLVKRQAQAFGVVLRDPNRIRSPHISEIIAGISRVASERDLSIVWTFQGDRTHSRLALLADGRVDGGIILEDEIWDEEELKTFAETSFPVVLLGHFPRRKGLHIIDSDDEAGIIAAVEHLVEQGDYRIAHLGSARHWAGAQREKGFRRAAALFGIEEYVRIHDINWSPAVAAEVVRQEQHQADAPTAYVCVNDIVALSVIRAVRECGKQVPDDVRVIGFNDSVFAAFSSPSLTSIRRPLMQLGEEACRRLCAVAYEKQRNLPPVVLATELVVRESSIIPGRHQGLGSES